MAPAGPVAFIVGLRPHGPFRQVRRARVGGGRLLASSHSSFRHAETAPRAAHSSRSEEAEHFTHARPGSRNIGVKGAYTVRRPCWQGSEAEGCCRRGPSLDTQARPIPGARRLRGARSGDKVYRLCSLWRRPIVGWRALRGDQPAGRHSTGGLIAAPLLPNIRRGTQVGALRLTASAACQLHVLLLPIPLPPSDPSAAETSCLKGEARPCGKTDSRSAFFLGRLLVGLAVPGWSSRRDCAPPPPDQSGTVANPSSGADGPARGRKTSLLPPRLQSGAKGWSANWRHGSFRYHVGGRIDWDSGWYRTPANLQASLNTPLQDGTDLQPLSPRCGRHRPGRRSILPSEADFSRGLGLQVVQVDAADEHLHHPWAGLPSGMCPYSTRCGPAIKKEYLTFSNGRYCCQVPAVHGATLYLRRLRERNSPTTSASARTAPLPGQAVHQLGSASSGTARACQAFNTDGRYAVSGRLTWMPVYDEGEQAAGSTSASAVRAGLSATTIRTC